MIPDGATSFPPPPPLRLEPAPRAGGASGEYAGPPCAPTARARRAARSCRTSAERDFIADASSCCQALKWTYGTRCVRRTRADGVAAAGRMSFRDAEQFCFSRGAGCARHTRWRRRGEHPGVQYRATPRVDLHHVRRGGRRARGDARGRRRGEDVRRKSRRDGGGAVLRQHVQHLHAEPHVSVARGAAVLAGDGADGVARDARARRRRAGPQPGLGLCRRRPARISATRSSSAPKPRRRRRRGRE